MAIQKAESPLRTLRSSVNKDILVRIKDGNSYYGRLIMTDPTMNVVMTDCEELRGEGEEPVARYGTVLIRGSQILYIIVGYKRK